MVPAQGRGDIMPEIYKGDCHSCLYRHSCCPHPIDEDCKYWKLGKCYTCKFVDDDDEWDARGCETWCFGGCKQYKRSWKKTFELLDKF